MRPSKPLVTVICSCFNQSDYVVEALNSVESQTYENIELIIINDGSTDSSAKVIKQWIGNKSLTFIDNPHPLGLNKSFNRGFNKSNGEYILDLAADDVLLSHSIEERVIHFEHSKDKGLGVVFSNIEYINREGKHIAYLYDINEQGQAVVPPVDGFIYKDLVQRFFISAASMLIKRDVLKELNGYDENLAYEDFDFWVRSSRIYSYAYVDKVLVKKRSLSDSLSSNFKLSNGRDLDTSTLIVCEKSFRLNTSEEEDRALIYRVNYHLRWAIKNRRWTIVYKYLLLLAKLKRRLMTA